MAGFGNRVSAAAKSLQSCPTLCNPRDGSPIPGILQARTREWVAISFSNAWKWKMKVKLLSRVWLLATPWTAAYQAPPSMGFSRQEYWSGVPLPSPNRVSKKVNFHGMRVFHLLWISGGDWKKMSHELLVRHSWTPNVHVPRFTNTLFSQRLSTLSGKKERNQSMTANDCLTKLFFV